MITSAQVDRIKSTFKHVQHDPDALGQAFYRNLFSVAPGVRDMFPGDMTNQARILANMLGYVVGSVDDLDALIPDLQKLGQRHATYGAQAVHFDVVGACMVETLAQSVPEWDKEDTEAWQSLYQFAANVMINAAQEEGRKNRSA